MIYYILQPFSDQAIVIARFIKENSSKRVVGVLLLDEKKGKSDEVYDDIIIVRTYDEINDLGVIVPTGAPSTEALLRKGDVQLGKIKMKKESLGVFDKVNFLNHCRQVSLPIPLMLEFNELKSSSFPLFYKEKNEKGGGLRGKANRFSDVENLPHENLIFQELIDSKGTYGVAFLAKNGRILTSFSHFEEESYPRTGGSATIIKKIEDSRLDQLTQKFVETYKYDGWGLAEYKYCHKRQDFVFMEVNAKFWASCLFTFKNNPEFLDMLFDISIEKEDINTMIYINRLLKTGLLNTLKVLYSYKGAKKIILKPFIKTIILGVFIDLKLVKL